MLRGLQKRIAGGASLRLPVGAGNDGREKYPAMTCATFPLQTPLGIAHFRGGHRGGTGRDGRRRNGPAYAPAGERRWLPWLQTSGQIGQLFIHVNQPRHREVPAPENHPVLHTGVRVCWTSFPPHRLNRRPGKSPASRCCRSETSAVEPYPPIRPGNRGR